jgi:hypothetical protein
MKLVNRKFWISMAVAGCASASTACFPLVVGGAAVGGLVRPTDVHPALSE